MTDLPAPGGRAGTVVAVTSGKGGVGKSTSSAALGAALASDGSSVVLVDMDVGLPNLHLVMGMERRVVYDVVSVISGAARLSQAVIQDRRCKGLYLLPAGSTHDKDALTRDGVAALVADLRSRVDWVVVDSPAGIENGAMRAMEHADVAVVVANPEISSVQDSDRMIGLIDSRSERARMGQEVRKLLLLTRYDARKAARGQIMTAADVQEVLAIDFLGIVPESAEVVEASSRGVPLTLHPRPGPAARAYRDAARRLRGEDVPMRRDGRPDGLLSRLVGGRLGR